MTAALTARAEKAEARAAETARELSYERQMRQQTEEAMVKLVRRVKEQQAELSEQERAKLLLIQETHRWSAAVKTLEAERVASPAGHKARAKAQAILAGTDPSPVNAALIQPR